MNAHSRRAFFGMAAATTGLLFAPGIAAATTRAGTRVLTIDGVLNCRDIGGYAAAGGRTVRWSTVYRSGALGAITDAGLQSLSALGLRVVVDFRTSVERTGSADRLPSGVVPISAPVGDGTTAASRFAAADAGPTPQTLAEYRSYVTNVSSRTSFAIALGAVHHTGSLPLLWHCNAGANRTGWATAVLLSVLGVPRDVIYQDFLLTNQVLGGTYLFADYLDAAFAQADQTFGSFAGYLSSGLRLDASAQSALRAALLV